MKTNRFAIVLVVGGLTVAASAVAFAVDRAVVGIDGLVSYGAVIALVGFTALDYGLRRRRLFGK
jgi:hypothetical protein